MPCISHYFKHDIQSVISEPEPATSRWSKLRNNDWEKFQSSWGKTQALLIEAAVLCFLVLHLNYFWSLNPLGHEFTNEVHIVTVIFKINFE